jgi:hypothetical protein
VSYAELSAKWRRHLNVTDSTHSAASTVCDQCEFPVLHEDGTTNSSISCSSECHSQLHEVATTPSQKGSDIHNDFSPLMTQQEKDKSMTRPVMASRSSSEQDLVLLLEKMHETVARKRRSSQGGCNKQAHGETPESACKNVEHADYTAEESFMNGAKDMRPDDLMDEEQAITLLRRHGFSDRRIEAILRRLDGADCESCGKRD